MNEEEINNQHSPEDLDLSWYGYVEELEKEWTQEQWQSWSERQWLEAFPEAKESIPVIFKEWEEAALDALCKCIQRRREIRRGTEDDFSQWFWLEWSKWNEGKEFLDACTQLDRLSQVIDSPGTLKHNHERFSGALDRARDADIVEIASKHLPQLRQSGKIICSKCPFHEERNPSFFLYPETSTYHCFGCQANGDAIDLLMK